MLNIKGRKLSMRQILCVRVLIGSSRCLGVTLSSQRARLVKLLQICVGLFLEICDWLNESKEGISEKHRSRSGATRPRTELVHTKVAMMMRVKVHTKVATTMESICTQAHEPISEHPRDGASSAPAHPTRLRGWRSPSYTPPFTLHCTSNAVTLTGPVGRSRRDERDG